MEQPNDHTRLKEQPSFLFWNRGDQGFVSVAEHAAPELAVPSVRRGGAQLDFDRDGRTDLITCEHGGSALLLRNVTEPAGNWVRLRLSQADGNTAALGARVYVDIRGARRMAEVGASASYLSQDERTLHFGLGTAKVIDKLEVVWPDGAVESRSNVSANQELALRRGAVSTPAPDEQ